MISLVKMSLKLLLRNKGFLFFLIVMPIMSTVVQRYKDIDVWNQTPVLKQESFDKLQTVMEAAGELSQKAPYDKIVNNKYASSTKE